MIAADWLTAAAVAVLAGVFGSTFGWTRHTNPRFATRALTAMCVIVTTALAATLAMLALPLAGRTDPLADRAHWSDAVFASRSAPGLTVGVLAALALGSMVLLVGRELRMQMRGAAAADRFRDELGATYGETVVAALREPDAMALSSGVIVITTGLVSALGADERRAVLAHERAHLQHRHHRYLRAAALLAAGNPLLHRAPKAIGYLTERWADEEAARATSRAIAANALDKAAGLSSGSINQTLATLHSATVDVPDRLVALAAAPRNVSWYRLVAPALLVLGVVAISLTAAERTLDLFQLASAVAHGAATR